MFRLPLRTLAPMLLLGTALLAAGCAPAAPPRQAHGTPAPVAGGSDALPVLAQVPSFELVHIDGTRVTEATLAGHPYILDFMFTTCTDFCPTMTAEMGKLRTALGASSTVRTVSVSVDPERDAPEKLKSYAASHRAVDPRWYFLTGQRKIVMGMLVALHLATPKEIEAPNPKLHSTRFILVDAKGQVRGYYRHDDPEGRANLLRDARALESHA